MATKKRWKLTKDTRSLIELSIFFLSFALVFSLLLYACSGSSGSATGTTHLGGKILLIGIILFVGAGMIWRRGAELIATMLAAIGTFCILLWLTPYIDEGAGYVLTTWQKVFGVGFNGIIALGLFFTIWALRKRDIPRLVLWIGLLFLVSGIGANSVLIYNGFKSFASGVGLDKIKMPQSLDKVADSIGNDFNQLANEKAADTARGEIESAKAIDDELSWWTKDTTVVFDCSTLPCTEVKYSFKEKVVELRQPLIPDMHDHGGVKLVKVYFPDQKGVFTEEYWIPVNAFIQKDEADRIMGRAPASSSGGFLSGIFTPPGATQTPLVPKAPAPSVVTPPPAPQPVLTQISVSGSYLSPGSAVYQVPAGRWRIESIPVLTEGGCLTVELGNNKFNDIVAATPLNLGNRVIEGGKTYQVRLNKTGDVTSLVPSLTLVRVN